MIFFIIIKHNSVRIKKKNFKKIGNKPLWQHLILNLKGEKVFVDTDSQKIIKEINTDKKFIRLESLKNASPTLGMIRNFLIKYSKNDNDIIVTTHVTSPFIKIKTIKDAAKKLKNYDSIAAVTKDYNFAWLENKKKKFIPINFDPKIITKTQNLNPIIQSNGAFFIFKKKTFMKYNNRIGKKPFYYEINYPEALEIDTYDDLYLARKICK
jgi:N-acylneuraminate cytidylyltransferase